MTQPTHQRTNHLNSKTPNGVVKETRYKWIIEDEPGVMKDIDKDLIHVHPDYQRPILKNKVAEITAAWSWAACGALSVAHDSGIYWVFDGQHRLAAAKRHESIKTLHCVVFRMNTQEQAAAFVKSNINRKQVTAFQKYNALIVSNDTAALTVQTIFGDLGLTLTGHPRRALETKCVTWALKTCEKDEARCRRVLGVASTLSVDSNGPVPDALLDSLAWIDANVGGGLGDKRLVARMRELGLANLVAGAEKGASYAREQNGGKFSLRNPGNAAYGKGMMDRVNSRLRKPFEVKA